MAGRDLGVFGQAVADVEAGDAPDTLTFYGQTFTVAAAVGAIPLMRFAHAARSGVGSNDLDGLSAMYDMIRDCLAPGEFERFETVAVEHKADGDVIMEVCKAVYEAIAGRPTAAPSSSSAGRRTTTSSSPRKSTRGRGSTTSTDPTAGKKPATVRAARKSAKVIDFGPPVSQVSAKQLRGGTG